MYAALRLKDTTYEGLTGNIRETGTPKKKERTKKQRVQHSMLKEIHGKELKLKGIPRL